MTTAGQNRHPHASESDNRLDWHLRETGEPPTRETLRRIREYRRTDRSVRASTAIPRRGQVAGAYPKDMQ